ncbi:hypothetical protein DMN91_003624 [Ooceraea biroi]|uniref:28S ribosomal protein S34, mitochondrial n=2 Tax=Ooceraea biroi TaxID=2015173 RepID=A0A3L8DSM2_OOCBI|nr:28S ribosomal protein S34, mitochondrial [Ooceraea biroi]RLU23420.1 hypothetical protein DMN91_003624 [Ooceraea biroi]
MPIKFIGRTNDFLGKPLWEILGNLKNYGVGRIVIRSRFQRYPEPSYLRILKVAALPPPTEAYSDRKVMVLAERVFRGMKDPKPIQIDSASYKADYMLIPKDKEHLYTESNAKLPEKRILPRTTDFPPLFAELIMQQMKAKGEAVVDKPQMTLQYNKKNMKNYRVAEEGETPTVKLNFSVSESSNLFPKPEDPTPT